MLLEEGAVTVGAMFSLSGTRSLLEWTEAAVTVAPPLLTLYTRNST